MFYDGYKSTTKCNVVQVIEAADVVLEVVDARDPMGTRCKQVEKAVLESVARKRLIIVVNKAGESDYKSVTLNIFAAEEGARAYKKFQPAYEACWFKLVGLQII